MSLAIRIALIVCAVGLLAFVLYNIRKSKLRIEDSLFWFLLSAIILVLAIVPSIATACSQFFKFQAPVNFVFLTFIAILLVKCFRMSIRASQLETKLDELVQQIAINEKEGEDAAAASGAPVASQESTRAEREDVDSM